MGTVEKKAPVQLASMTNGAWMCYACTKTRQRVVSIPGTKGRYYCEECLFNGVANGRLVVTDFDKHPDQPPAGPELAVIDDDGTVTTDNGIQITW